MISLKDARDWASQARSALPRLAQSPFLLSSFVFLAIGLGFQAYGAHRSYEGWPLAAYRVWLLLFFVGFLYGLLRLARKDEVGRPKWIGVAAVMSYGLLHLLVLLFFRFNFAIY
jgi:hypothetical protein